jgi:hypothetical protein
VPFPWTQDTTQSSGGGGGTAGAASGLAAWLSTATAGESYIDTDDNVLHVCTVTDTTATSFGVSFGVTTLPIVAWSASNGATVLAYAVANLWTISGAATATIPNAVGAGTSTAGPVLVVMNAVGSTGTLTISDPTPNSTLTGTPLIAGQSLILTTAGVNWQTYSGNTPVGALLSANNLSDLRSPAVALANVGAVPLVRWNNYQWRFFN